MKIECVLAASVSISRHSKVAPASTSTGTPVAPSTQCPSRETRRTVAPVAATEMVGQILLLPGEHVDRKIAALEDQAVRVGVAMHADQQLRRLCRKRADRGRGHAGAEVAQAGGHDGDAAGEPAHAGEEIGGGDRQASGSASGRPRPRPAADPQ